MASRSLFDDVLLETSSGERRRRKLTLFATLAGEALVIAAVIALPLLYLDAVPGYTVRADTLHLPVTPAPIGLTDAPREPGSHSSRSGPVAIAVTHPPLDPLLTYGNPQARHQAGSGDDSIDGPPNVSWGCPTCVPGGTGTNLVAAPNIPSPPPKPHIISHVEEGMILHRVEPVYPRIAREARIQGDVVLRAIISKDGRIEGLQVVSGHPLLAPAAVNAVSQWRFRPYQLNGSPVEVDAQITVRFHF